MLKKDYKVIREAYLEEREIGHTLCDFDDEEHDLMEMAELLGVEMIENEECEYVFKVEKDEIRCKEALNYYYELHGH